MLILVASCEVDVEVTRFDEVGSNVGQVFAYGFSYNVSLNVTIHNPNGPDIYEVTGIWFYIIPTVEIYIVHSPLSLF